jgi:hypothetical protein
MKGAKEHLLAQQGFQPFDFLPRRFFSLRGGFLVPLRGFLSLQGRFLRQALLLLAFRRSGSYG